MKKTLAQIAMLLLFGLLVIMSYFGPDTSTIAATSGGACFGAISAAGGTIRAQRVNDTLKVFGSLGNSFLKTLTADYQGPNSTPALPHEWFNSYSAGSKTFGHSRPTFNDISGMEAPATWVTPSFNAGDYTASGSMTWTVDAGDVYSFRYKIEGKTMTIIFYLFHTTVGGTLSSNLIRAIPEGKTAANYTGNPVQLWDNGVPTTGIATVDSASNYIKIWRSDFQNYTAATNATDIIGQITFEIQ